MSVTRLDPVCSPQNFLVSGLRSSMRHLHGLKCYITSSPFTYSSPSNLSTAINHEVLHQLRGPATSRNRRHPRRIASRAPDQRHKKNKNSLHFKLPNFYLFALEKDDDDSQAEIRAARSVETRTDDERSAAVGPWSSSSVLREIFAN